MTSLSEKDLSLLEKTASTIRRLAVDAIQEAQSGHIGLPLGCAEIGAYVYGHFLRVSPHNPSWINRDLFVLSAGHGVLLQYICLHLKGFPITLEDLKKYRKGGSITPSHPEFGKTPGIEVTAGADGQGIGIAVGQALGLKILQGKFNSLLNNKVVVLAGDGCMMEGIAAESCSLAEHLKLDNLILLYDRNETTLDGYLKEISTEDIALRYRAYDFDVVEIDGHDVRAIHAALELARTCQTKPLLVMCKTVIGKGALSTQGTPAIHSGPLSTQDAYQTKELLGKADFPFFVHEEVYHYFDQHNQQLQVEEKKWQVVFDDWKAKNPLFLRNMKSIF